MLLKFLGVDVDDMIKSLLRFKTRFAAADGRCCISLPLGN